MIILSIIMYIACTINFNSYFGHCTMLYVYIDQVGTRSRYNREVKSESINKCFVIYNLISRD